MNGRSEVKQGDGKSEVGQAYFQENFTQVSTRGPLCSCEARLKWLVRLCDCRALRVTRSLPFTLEDQLTSASLEVYFKYGLTVKEYLCESYDTELDMIFKMCV